MRAVLPRLLCLATVLLVNGPARSQDAPALDAWPIVSGAAAETMHVLPDNGAAPLVQPTEPPKVETGSIDPNAALPPNADIGQAARALIPVPPAPAAPIAALEAAPSPGTDGPAAVAPPAPVPPTPEEADQTALIDFYSSRRDEPVWVTKSGYTDRAMAAIAEMRNAGEWGLDASEFDVPALPSNAATELARDDLAKAEMNVSLAVLKYARFARGGRIPDPAQTLSSYLDRRPQLRDRKTLLDALAKSDKPADVLIGLHPQQPQFNLLRQAWLETQRVQSAKGVKLDAKADLKPGDRNPAVAQLLGYTREQSLFLVSIKCADSRRTRHRMAGIRIAMEKVDHPFRASHERVVDF